HGAQQARARGPRAEGRGPRRSMSASSVSTVVAREGGDRQGRGGARIAALWLLYAAQGVPFGIATDYLPVVLREAHHQMGRINLLGWLQLPWQVKFLWAHAADGPLGRRHGRALLLALQLALAGSVAL